MAIVIDTSAIIAFYKSEADAPRFWSVLESEEALFLPVTCYLECVMVLRTWQGSRPWLDQFLSSYHVQLPTCDAAQIQVAADAFERFGRGSGHPAKLNFGDCLAYAAARALGAPLLFKGADFAATDIMPALAAA